MFLLISCALSGDLHESPDSGQYSGMKAMKWNLQNHVEMQKLGAQQQHGLVSGSRLSAVSRGRLLLSLHIYVSCSREAATPATGLCSSKMSVLKDKVLEERV